MPKCKLLDNHMCLNLNGHIKPCAIYKSNPKLNFSSKTYQEYKQSQSYKTLVENMENGWDEGCEKCRIDEENPNGISFRKFFLDKFNSQDKLEFVEISLSNYCNYSCRMCNPVNSTSWQKMIKNKKQYDVFFPAHPSVFSPFKPINIDPKQIFKNINLKDLKTLKYLGGEPFVSPELYQLIDYIETNANQSDIDFQIATNCSFFPHKAVNKLKKFKSVVIDLSIDGYKQSCEYSRLGSDWNNIHNNVLKFVDLKKECKNIHVKIHSTVNAYTVHDVKNIKNYADEFLQYDNNISFYNLCDPSHLSTSVLPKDYKDKIIDDHNREYMNNFDQKLFEKFVNFTKIVDKSTGKYIKDYLPFLAKFLL